MVNAKAHVTYFPMEAKYGISLWHGDTMVAIDYTLYDTKWDALAASNDLRKKVFQENQNDN